MRTALEKIRINTHPEWPDDPVSHRKAPVTITMKNGRKFSKLVETVRGHPANPIGRELVGKYRLCASRVLKGEALERSIIALEGLDKLDRAGNCVDTLVL